MKKTTNYRCDYICTGCGATGVKLFFDSESGLLVRQVHFVDTAVGVIPTQVDYSDYRAVGGVKVPFPRLRRIESFLPATARSGVRSPLTSPIAAHSIPGTRYAV